MTYHIHPDQHRPPTPAPAATEEELAAYAHLERVRERQRRDFENMRGAAVHLEQHAVHHAARRDLVSTDEESAAWMERERESAE